MAEWEIVELPKRAAKSANEAAKPKANFFDQFDEPTGKPKGNFFDQFDAPGGQGTIVGLPAKPTGTPIDIRAPDGSIARFPDGTSDDVIKGVMRKQFGAPTGVADAPAAAEPSKLQGFLTAAKQALGMEVSAEEKANEEAARAAIVQDAKREDWRDTLLSADGARLVAQGVTLGAADEIEAGVRSLGSETYDDALESVRSSVAAAREKPGALPIEMASGLLVPGGYMARGVAQAPTFARSVWAATKAGGALGGAAGFAGSEGAAEPDASILDHAAERAKGGAFGATLGAGLGAVLPTAGGAARFVGRVAKARLGVGDEQYAREALAAALSSEATATGRTAPAIADELETTGLPLGLAGNQSINALAHSAAEHSPVARRQMIDMIADTEGGAGRRVERAIDDVMQGERAGDTAYAINESSKLNADRGYERLYGRNAVHDMGAVVDVDAPTMRAAVAKANRWLADEHGLAIDDVSAMTMKQVDYVSRALDDAVDRAFKSGSGQHGAKLAEQRDAFLRAAYKANPHYRDVRAAYARDSDSLRAVEAGRSVKLKDSAETEEFVHQLGEMTPRDRRNAQLGVLQNLRDSVRNAAEAPNAIRSVAESPARARNLADIMTPLADEVAPVMGNHTRRSLEALADVFEREARAVRGAQALRQGLPDYEGGLRGLLQGVDPASVAVQPKATLTRVAARYLLDDMNPRRAALVAALLRDTDTARMAAVARAQLAQRGVTVGDWTTRANAALAAMQASFQGYREPQQ